MRLNGQYEDDMIDVCGVVFACSRDAVGMVVEGENHWFPRQHCPDIEHLTHKDVDTTIEFECPLWLAKAKGLYDPE